MFSPFFSFSCFFFLSFLCAPLQGLIGSMVGGQQPAAVTSSNVQLAAHRTLPAGLHGGGLTPPQTSEAATYSLPQPTLILPPTGLARCGGSPSHYSQISIMLWGTNPYPGSAEQTTPLLRFGNSAPAVSRRRLKAAQKDQPQPFYFVMQFAAPVATNGSAHNSSNPIKIPACNYKNPDGDGYLPCPCNQTQHTATNVTFKCADTAFLCPPSVPGTAKRARRLSIELKNQFFSFDDFDDFGTIDGKVLPDYSIIDSPLEAFSEEEYDEEDEFEDEADMGDHRELGSSSSGGDDSGSSSSSSYFSGSMTSTNIDTGAILAALLAAFASVLSQNPFDIDINKAKGILIFIGILLFIWGVGCYGFNHWDIRDKTDLIYLRSLKRDDMEEEGYSFDLKNMFLLNNLADKALFQSQLGGKQGMEDVKVEKEKEMFKKERFNEEVFSLEDDLTKTNEKLKAVLPESVKYTKEECQEKSKHFFLKMLPATMLRDHDTTFKVRPLTID